MLEEALQFAFRRAQLNGELAAAAEPRSLARFLLEVPRPNDKAALVLPAVPVTLRLGSRSGASGRKTWFLCGDVGGVEEFDGGVAFGGSLRRGGESSALDVFSRVSAFDSVDGGRLAANYGRVASARLPR